MLLNADKDTTNIIRSIRLMYYNDEKAENVCSCLHGFAD